LTFRAIVIDDMSFCRDLLTDFLEERGYQVLSYPDVTSCPLFPARNAECDKAAPCADFLLTDNRMPHMQGLDFLELLSLGKCKINSLCKAIFSAHWTQEELAQANNLGCEVFHKPYDLDKLSSWLEAQERKIPANRQLLDLDQVMAAKGSGAAK